MPLIHAFASPLGAYLAVLGASLLLGGLVMLVMRLRMWIFGCREVGEVVGHKARMKAHVGEKTSYMPIVSFRANGIRHEFQSRTGASLQTWPVGARVRVSYLPARPEAAEISERLHLWIAPLGLIGFGAALILAAAKAAN